MLSTKTRTFSGNVIRTAHVATVNESNLMLYGILLTGDLSGCASALLRLKMQRKSRFLARVPT